MFVEMGVWQFRGSGLNSFGLFEGSGVEGGAPLKTRHPEAPGRFHGP